MPISPLFTSVLEETFEINFLQCYPNGLLKPTDLCNILQLTAAKHAELGGISFTDMQAHHQAWVLSRSRIEIERMPRWRDTITVKTWIQSLENSRSIRCLEVFLGNEKIAGCETFWAVFNTQTRRPETLALPHEHFKKFPTKATATAFKKIDISLATEFVSFKKVMLSDLDIVNHANSVKYMEWCLDTLAPEQLLKQKIAEIEVNYLKEVAFHDTVSIHERKEDKSSIFNITKDEKVCFSMEIGWK
jgi:medium-chain acyl-[acyl-carrier-protein] hydrolase